ncbi:MAG: Crp/Fnr family transcriptional regulator [Cyanobacteria bacterium P01_A01_bin.105]
MQGRPGQDRPGQDRTGARGSARGADLIAAAPFFEELPEASVHQATAQVVTRRHPAGQVILLENDWGNSVYFILEGWVKIRTYNLDGKEVTLNILGKGELFGEMAPLESVPRSTDVITLAPTVIGSMPAQDFVTLLRTEPMAGIRLAMLMARRLRQVNRRLRLRESDSQSRVADILLFLAESQGTIGEAGFEIPNLPHRELSSLSGLARETVTRVLSKLEKRDLIARERDVIRIPSLDDLERLLV